MRSFWFVTGAGVGVYVVVKARRAAEAFTPEGLRDRMSALSVGLDLFSQEVRIGMTEKETELRQRLGLALDGPRELAAAEQSDTDTAQIPSQTPSQTPSQISSPTHTPGGMLR